jgi:hypothetical protein
MADPVSGTVLGAVGLGVSVMSLATLFNSCVECWQFVEGARNLGKDSELLLCKLTVERFRFEQWGICKYSSIHVVAD